GLQGHWAEGEVRLDREHEALCVVRQPDARFRLLGKDPAPLRNLGAHDERPPLLARDAHPLAADDLDDHRVAVRPEIARILILLADLERHRPNPVEKGGIVEWLENRRERRVAPYLSVESRVRVDLVASLPVLVALVLDRRESPRTEVVASDPRLDGLVEVVPERAARDAKPDVHRLGAVYRVDAHDFH